MRRPEYKVVRGQGDAYSGFQPGRMPFPLMSAAPTPIAIVLKEPISFTKEQKKRVRRSKRRTKKSIRQAEDMMYIPSLKDTSYKHFKVR